VAAAPARAVRVAEAAAAVAVAADRAGPPPLAGQHGALRLGR
jgi:hypothetical protein